MATNASAGNELSEDLGEQAGAYMILPTGRRNHSGGPKSSSLAKPPPETELSEGLGEQAGAYMILPTPGRHNHNSSSPSTEGGAGEAPFNFSAAGAIEAGYEVVGGGVATMMELDRGIAGKAISATAAGARMVFAGDEGAGAHSFADPAGRGGGATTTTVDVARMKADETIGAAMKAAKEAGDVVAGHKWF